MISILKNKYTTMYGLIIVVSMIMSGCSKKDKQPEDLKPNEIKTKIIAYLNPVENKEGLDLISDEQSIENIKNPEEVLNLVAQFVAKYPEDKQISHFKLLLANLYLKEGKLLAAQQMYQHFQDFYPSDSRSEYATYKTILSKFYQTLKVGCDQTITEETIKLCENYLESPFYYEYKNDVFDIQNTCNHKLIDKEIYVHNFYIKKGQYKSAQNRLDFLKSKYADNNPALQARLLYLECKQAHKQKKMDNAQEKLEALIDQYPKSRFTQMASSLISKSKHAFF